MCEDHQKKLNVKSKIAYSILEIDGARKLRDSTGFSKTGKSFLDLEREEGLKRFNELNKELEKCKNCSGDCENKEKKVTWKTMKKKVLA
jgi:hypothetical protein